MNSDSEVHLDIGAGKEAEYVKRLAGEFPGRKYLVLEPELREKPVDWPSNVELLHPEDSASFSIPLGDRSVDKASCNFLCGELHDDPPEPGEGSGHGIFDVPRSYLQLLVEIKRVLKRGGTVEITEPLSNIQTILPVLERIGFEIMKQPAVVHDKNKTSWTRFFSTLAGDAPLTDSSPMELEAVSS